MTPLRPTFFKKYVLCVASIKIAQLSIGHIIQSCKIKYHIYSFYKYFAVIILFNAGLCQSAFFPYSFRKLVLHLSVFSVFSVCVSNSMRSLRLQCLEFAKLRAFRAYVPYVPMHLTCLRAFVPQISTCLRAYIP